MKITIESTETFISFRGVACRLWKGTDETGQPVLAGVVGVGVSADGDRSAFERDLLAVCEVAVPVPTAWS